MQQFRKYSFQKYWYHFPCPFLQRYSALLILFSYPLSFFPRLFTSHLSLQILFSFLRCVVVCPVSRPLALFWCPATLWRCRQSIPSLQYSARLTAPPSDTAGPGRHTHTEYHSVTTTPHSTTNTSWTPAITTTTSAWSSCVIIILEQCSDRRQSGSVRQLYKALLKLLTSPSLPNQIFLRFYKGFSSLGCQRKGSSAKPCGFSCEKNSQNLLNSPIHTPDHLTIEKWTFSCRIS